MQVRLPEHPPKVAAGNTAISSVYRFLDDKDDGNLYLRVKATRPVGMVKDAVPFLKIAIGLVVWMRDTEVMRLVHSNPVLDMTS